MVKWGSFVFSGSLIHQSHELDGLEINNVFGSTQGFHIYHVEDTPNNTSGIIGLGSNDHYFGVFKAGEVTTTTYTATYYYDENDAWQSSVNNVNEVDLTLFTRSNNSVMSWADAGAYINPSNKSLIAIAQSTEFIIGATGGVALPVELVNFYVDVIDNNAIEITWQTLRN